MTAVTEQGFSDLASFSLSLDATRVLLTLQRALVEADLAVTVEGGERHRKTAWLEEWERLAQSAGKELSAPEPILYDRGSLQRAIAQLPVPGATRGLIAFELICFVPYSPLGPTPESDKKDEVIDVSQKVVDGYLKAVSDELGLGAEFPNEVRSELKSVARGLKGFWTKLAIYGGVGAVLSAITMGVLAPYIAAAIGAQMGLFGAAAFSAGMAAIAGGAIAVGGFGVAGGLVILVGGGALLGAATMGTSAALMASFSPAYVLAQLTKLEVCVRLFFRGQDVVGVVMRRLRHLKAALEEERDRLLAAPADADSKLRLGEFRDVIGIMNKSLDRHEELLRPPEPNDASRKNEG